MLTGSTPLFYTQQTLLYVFWDVILCSLFEGSRVTHLETVHPWKMGTFIACGYVT